MRTIERIVERSQDETDGGRSKVLFQKKEIQLIAKNYNLEHSPSDEKIADYDIDILIISPKFASRPTKHIFFARDNGVILRVEDLDSEGVLREMSVYTQISFDPKNRGTQVEKVSTSNTARNAA